MDKPVLFVLRTDGPCNGRRFSLAVLPRTGEYFVTGHQAFLVTAVVHRCGGDIELHAHRTQQTFLQAPSP